LRTKTIENYIELIYRLQKEKKRVHTNDIASAFDINPASVTEIFQKLNEEGYIIYEKYNGVILTKKGEKLALKTFHRHNQLKDFLKILGVDQKTAEKDACEMEHILHKSTMKAIIKFIENKKKN
jgi:Mn-dependent DtxR family transcriptional regulator